MRCEVGGRQMNSAFMGSVLGVPLAQLSAAPAQYALTTSDSGKPGEVVSSLIHW